MHCDLRPPEPRHRFAALITTSLMTPNLSIAVLKRFCCWYTTLRCDLWPLTVNICSLSPVTWRNTVPNLNAIEPSAGSYCDFSVWPYDLEHVLSVALGSVIIFTKFDLRQLIRAWIIAFWCWYVMLSCDFELWPVDLECSWYIKCHVIKVCTKFEQSRVIRGWIIDNCANFCTRYVTPWPWSLTSWLWSFTTLRVSCG